MLPNESEEPHPADDPDAAFSAFKVSEAADGDEVSLCRERDQSSSDQGQSCELYEQLIRAATVMLKDTGVLLPMYDKALFSDAAYTAIMKASENIAAVRLFTQIQ